MPLSPADLVTHVDDAVPSALLARTRAALDEIGDRASYWKTFWFPFADAPACLPEAVALALRPRVPGAARFRGVEWWIGRMHTTDVKLDFHHDRDLALFEATGRVAHPSFSSVLFFTSVRGGALCVTDQRLVRRGETLSVRPAEATVLATVRPAPNRFAVFPGRFLHGVLDAGNQVPTRRLPGPKGEVRLTLVFNWWTRRPRAVRRWRDTRLYRPLAIR